jgi:HEAT repeat protein
MSISDYQFPVSELLNYGDCRNYQEWPDYVQKLNLEAQHIPELLRMATDEELNQAGSDSKQVWSPVHAWRALGQLKAISALEPLLGLLNNPDDDWISSDLPTLCRLIGLKSIPLLKEFLADSSNNLYARIHTAEALATLSQEYPETREPNVAAIAQELEKFRDNDSTFNGLLIGILVDLQAVEAIKIMEQAFQANQVDTFLVGDWEDIQVELRLKNREEVPKRRFREPQVFAPLFSSSSPNPTKVSKGFGSPQPKPTRKKSRKSSSKRKKS